MPGRPVTFVTIATPDRAAQSRVLARSARVAHPEARLAVLALGEAAAGDLFEDDYDLVIRPEQLPLPFLADMRFRYSTAELCFALKPWVMRHLLDGGAGHPVYYVDSDIEFFGPLVEVEMAMAAGAGLVLTPHLLAPLAEPPGEAALLQSGTYNGGFIAVAPTIPGRAFLAWWGERLKTGGTLEATCGDQKWLDLAPSLFDGVTILRHPGYNFAFWNAGERPLGRASGGLTAADMPLRFVHYTKWRLEQQSAGDYLAAYFRQGDALLAQLLADYEAKVRDAERPGGDARNASSGLPPAAAGEPVPDHIRRAYARHAPAVNGDSAVVFAAAAAVLNAPSRRRAALPLPITVLYDELWRDTPELQSAFDVDRLGGRAAYLRWLAECGAAELEIPERFLAPARAALALSKPERSAAAAITGDDAEWLPLMHVGPAGQRGPDGVAAMPAGSGHLVYGPYARLDPGDYRLRVRWRPGPSPGAAACDGPVAAIEVVTQHGRRYLARRELAPADCFQPLHELAFTVGAPPIFPLEVRIWTAGVLPLTITSITVEREPRLGVDRTSR